jgi:hypothetical protein
LEGLPVSSQEVVMFDGRTWLKSDMAGLVLAWAVIVLMGVVAAWGDSLVLGLLTLAAAVVVGAWSWARVRSRLAARRMMRHRR